YDVPTGAEAGPFTAHRGPVLALAFNADGSRLASGSADTTAVVWDFAALRPKPTPPAGPATPDQLDRWRADLGSDDGPAAGAAGRADGRHEPRGAEVAGGAAARRRRRCRAGREGAGAAGGRGAGARRHAGGPGAARRSGPAVIGRGDQAGIGASPEAAGGV